MNRHVERRIEHSVGRVALHVNLTVKRLGDSQNPPVMRDEDLLLRNRDRSGRTEIRIKVASAEMASRLERVDQVAHRYSPKFDHNNSSSMTGRSRESAIGCVANSDA